MNQCKRDLGTLSDHRSINWCKEPGNWKEIFTYSPFIRLMLLNYCLDRGVHFIYCSLEKSGGINASYTLRRVSISPLVLPSISWCQPSTLRSPKPILPGKMAAYNKNKRPFLELYILMNRSAAINYRGWRDWAEEFVMHRSGACIFAILDARCEDLIFIWRRWINK